MRYEQTKYPNIEDHKTIKEETIGNNSNLFDECPNFSPKNMTFWSCIPRQK